MVLRLIPKLPPTLDEMFVSQGIRAGMAPGNGLVLITGVMGQGKSTLLSGMLRWMMENEDRHIGTFEDPIEFDLMSMNQIAENMGRGGMIIQSQIGINFPDFKQTAKNSTRRAVDVCLYGEVRDTETMRGMIEQAEVGTLVYATAHTKAVSATPSRILNTFEHAERPAMSAAFFSAVRMIVQQRLLLAPKNEAGVQNRYAIREYLIFNEDMRQELLLEEDKNWTYIIEEMVENSGVSLLKAAEEAFNDGKICEESFMVIQAEKMRDKKFSKASRKAIETGVKLENDTIPVSLEDPL
jgi:defect-in-organelle-trafficking protein DotB